MAFPYILTAAARADLTEIFDYTQLNYGQNQAVTYLSELSEVFSDLGHNPLSGSARSEIRKGLRSFPKGRHLVFYRVLSDRIRIIRVLSMTQDVKRVLDTE